VLSGEVDYDRGGPRRSGLAPDQHSGHSLVKALDRERLMVRAAHSRTGIAAADFSRLRNADLGQFTVDRLMSVLNRLSSSVEVSVRVHPAGAYEAAATTGMAGAAAGSTP
jgi:hypothetical protein